MRHHALFGVAALAVFALWPWASRLGPAPSAGLLLALSLLLAVAASGEVNAVTTAAGALGGLSATALAPQWPALAGVALVGGAFLERTERVRRGGARALHLLLALGAGALVFVVEQRFATAALELRATALVVAVALAGLPLLLPAESAAVHLLSLAAERSRDGLRATLAEAASLRRLLGSRSPGLAERRGWAHLLELVRQRVALGVVTVPDEPAGFRAAPARIVDHEQAAVRRLDEAITAAVDSLRSTHPEPRPSLADTTA